MGQIWHSHSSPHKGEPEDTSRAGAPGSMFLDTKRLPCHRAERKPFPSISASNIPSQLQDLSCRGQ